MADKTYSEKLRDPRWQKKRLEIMSRDDFTCQFCEDKESTLNVHHIRYTKGAEPWEYEGYYLITLCESCHSEESNRRQNEEILIDAFAFSGISSIILNCVACDLYSLSRLDRKKAVDLVYKFRQEVGAVNWDAFQKQYLNG